MLTHSLNLDYVIPKYSRIGVCDVGAKNSQLKCSRAGHVARQSDN